MLQLVVLRALLSYITDNYALFVHTAILQSKYLHLELKLHKCNANISKLMCWFILCIFMS